MLDLNHPYMTDVRPHLDAAILACKRNGFDLFFLTVIAHGHSNAEIIQDHGFLVVSNGEKPHSWAAEVIGVAGTE